MEPLQCTAGVNLAQPLHCVRFLFHEKSGKCCFQRWDCHGAILHPTSEPYSFSRSFHAKCHQRHHITFCFAGYITRNSFPSGSWMENGLGARNERGKGGVIFAKTFRPISESDSGMKRYFSSSSSRSSAAFRICRKQKRRKAKSHSLSRKFPPLG